MTKSMPSIHVVGVGLSGASSLTASSLAIVKSATLLIGARRLVESIQETLFDASLNISAASGPPIASDPPIASQPIALQSSLETLPETWVLNDFTKAFDDLRVRLATEPATRAVVLTTGDPLFFGLGRLLLSAFPAEQLVFHPQVSAVQLAFSRLKLPWQDATLVSVHGRGEALLTRALKRGDAKIAVLTDGILTPQAIAKVVEALEIPTRYQLWVCENLGATGGAVEEQVTRYDPMNVPEQGFSSLNVVVLLREQEDSPSGNFLPEAGQSQVGQPEEYKGVKKILPRLNTTALPLIGLPDSAFKGYVDRPM
ncbi:MAG: precorrin-6y C5,15-methyltransferase (decarboxylating) subunit CbiE, partial [Pseudomonadota bacterium]